jgi:hypothetical protein
MTRRGLERQSPTPEASTLTITPTMRLFVGVTTFFGLSITLGGSLYCSECSNKTDSHDITEILVMLDLIS